MIMKHRFTILFILSVTVQLIGQTFVPLASYRGTHEWERAAYWVDSAGDVNGDGYDDVLLGVCHSGRNLWDSGSTYLILGKAQANWNFNVSLHSADAIFVAEYANYSGYPVAGGYDVNGDGYDDFLIGSAGRTDRLPNYNGRAFLIFGRAQANWGNDFRLDTNADVTFWGEAVDDHAGIGLDMIGDINRDGYDDFIIAAYSHGSGAYYGGKVYLFLGKSSGWQSDYNLNEADASFISRLGTSMTGYCVTGLGDVNGDTIPDFIVGSYTDFSKIYLFWGREAVDWGQNFELTDADVVIIGSPYDDGTGRLIAEAGDVNGDGFNDILISEESNSDLGYRAANGKAYLIFGKSSGWNPNFYLVDDADASFVGEAYGDNVGALKSLAGGADINNDGYDDILIGAPFNDDADRDAGKAYIIYGKASGWQQNVSLSTISDTFLGSDTSCYFGDALNFVGDVNNNGLDEFVISAPYNSESYKNAGKSYLYTILDESNDVSGNVHYYTNNDGVPDVDLSIQSAQSETVSTNSTGVYTFSVNIGGDATITPEKPESEHVYDGAVSAFDAALVARNTMGLNEFNTYQQRIADMDSSGVINIFDAALIARYSVGLPKLSGTFGGEWVFWPENIQVETSTEDVTDQDFESAIMGDVDGSWNNADALQKSDLNVFIEHEVLSTQTDSLKIRFYLKGDFELMSLDIVLDYANTGLTLHAIQKADMFDDFKMFYNCNEQEIARIAFFNPIPLCSESNRIPLMDLCCSTADAAKHNNNFYFKTFRINGQKVSTVTDVDETDAIQVPQSFELHQNYPNPFNSETVIQYTMNYPGQVSLIIFDVLGRHVKTLVDFYQPAGMHTMHWDGKDADSHDVQSGIYLAKLIYGTQQKQIKILKIN